MKVLVIYDIIPESQKKAIIEMTQEEYDYFSKTNNYSVNLDNDIEKEEISMVISDAFCDDQLLLEQCESDKGREYFGKWKDEEVIQDISGVDKMIITSFII